jgi:diguanylate cyclase (GGDEF)-like protein
MNYSVLPSLVALAILVLVFRTIVRRGPREQHLWVTGWALVLFHFVAQFVEAGGGLRELLASTLGLDALELASLAFLISVSPMATTRRRRLLLAGVLGIPVLAYTNAVIWDFHGRGLYLAVIAIGAAGALSLIWNFNRNALAYPVGISLGCVVLSAAMVFVVLRGRFDLGIIFLLAALNFAVAMLCWRRFRRASIGVLTTVFGFVAWGTVFPAGALLQSFAPSVNVQSEVWNIPKYFVAVGMILIVLEDEIRRSEYLAYHDELTGLPNRRLLEDRLEQALARAQRTAGKIAVLLLDLDHFKEVNDTFGHRIGDLALRQVVARLAGRMRASETLARSGGDEFTIVSDVPDRNGAATLVADLEVAFTIPFKLEGRLVHTGLSVGLALYPDDGSTADELYAAADRAMYVAKRAGRVSAATPEALKSLV